MNKTEEGKYIGPLIQIRFLERCGRGICGSVVAVGARFCISLVSECSTLSHTLKIGSGEALPVGKEGAWLVMDPSSTYLQY